MRSFRLFIKRTADIFLSLTGIIIFLPIIMIIGIIMQFFMPGPILFRQERIGKNGKSFWIYKLRSMRTDQLAEELHDFSKDEERTPGFGFFLRRHKIDELPQLINVLTGEMSLVGPRPLVVEQCRNYPAERFIMAPGMTGLAQVNGNTCLTWDKRLEYDIEYIRTFTICNDIIILWRTAFVILFGEEYCKGE